VSDSRDAEDELLAHTPGELRADLEGAVLRELHGPAGGPDEEVTEPSVRDRYLVGMLAPRRQRVEPQEQDGLAVAGTDSAEEGTAEPDAPSIRTMFPSSFGFTFTVASDAGPLRITAGYGRYERVHSETLTKDDGSPDLVWKRVPVERRIDDVRLAEGRLGPLSVEEERPEVLVHGSVRRRGQEWIVSLFLVNTQTEPDKRKDAAWVFQPELSVEAMDGSAVFVRRWLGRGTNRADAVSGAEDAAMAMLYRRRVEFAVGHGVAVHAEPSPDDPARAVRMSTRVVPRYEVPAVDAPRREEMPDLAGLALDMKELGECAPEDLVPRLRALPEAYRRWIEERRGEIGDPASGLSGHEESARAALDACEQACVRIEEGIALLARDPVAADAFRFMNRAMALQRVHTLLSEKARRGEEADLAALDTPENHSWYPFQLAFVLLSLPGVTDLHHKDRSPGADAAADLLWFPAGGGKTEAYLGLSAYTLALRRLQGEVAGRSGEAGVAVLMRYTLRLLTLQQFQRAVALVCACEKLRRDAVETGDARFGAAPFRIGLWVGQRTTPNRTEESIEAIKRDHGRYARASIVGGRGSPAQLTNCPWCGSKIEPGRHIKGEPFSKGRGRTLLYCGDSLGRCLFSEKNSPGEGIPALVVDEEIYRLLPSILIATVDKFAQMPWQGATQTLFGQVNGRCPRHGFRAPELQDSDSHTRAGDLPAVRTEPCGPLRPPDLVIQDELHLISGPLGTLVGLYETSIDRLMTWEVDGKPVRPKVIASTATIRRAREQVHGLFLRRVEVFPPHGTDVADNFFSRQRAPEEKPGRVYLGVCAHGKRLKGALIRVYVAFLAAAQQLYERHGAAADPWMTLVGYFNSIRELGGMRRVVDDDVRTRLRRMEQRGLARRNLNNVEELTSRKGSTDIPRILDWLEERFDPKLDEQRKAKRERRPLDVILATNMISVGVDVRRLGLMVVAGQPKTTAEYIQATSRVGRQMPGIVCSVFNWARPRDVSHYERFEHYHATFYQHVEALSVTPFAARALDRALSAQLVSLVRLSGMEFNENLAAARVEGAHERVIAAVEAIAARAEEVVGRREVADEVRSLLRSRLDVWQAQARRPGGGARLGYKTRKDGQTIGLLKHAGQGSWEDFTCLDSLRDVEPTSALVLDDHGLDDEGDA